MYTFTPNKSGTIVYSTSKSGIYHLKQAYEFESETGLNYGFVLGQQFYRIDIKNYFAVCVIDTIESEVLKFKAKKKEHHNIERIIKGYTHISNISLLMDDPTP